MAINVLLVDDSKTMRSVLKKTLRMAEVPIKECLEAENGQQGLEMTKNNWVDLVFVDINMPVMNGVEMIEKMADDDLMSTIPVIVVSTEGSQTRIDYLKSKGIAGFLRKPFEPEQIKSIVDEIQGIADAA